MLPVVLTKATLAAMKLCDSLLQRVWSADVADTLNCNDMLAVDTDQRK